MSKTTATGTFNYNHSDIENLYSTIFSKAESNNFFSSPIWLGEWLNHLQQKPELITFHHNSKVCGFVLVGYIKSFLGLKAFVNQTGERKFDQVWTEYNDVISLEYKQECRNALLSYLGRKNNVYKVHISNTAIDNWQHRKWKEWSNEAVKAYETQLSDKAICDNFSKNTKRQISRSKSFIEQELGPITLSWLDKNNFKENLKEISKLHIQQWDSHEYGSGFSNEYFVNFHTNLIQNGLGDYVHIAKFKAGDHILGFLYFYSFSNRIYFYLSAINYLTENNKFKPGLVMHEQAMQYFKSLEFDYYDFLAGEARYKASLCSEQYELYNKILYAKKLKYAPVKWLVDLKRKIENN